MKIRQWMIFPSMLVIVSLAGLAGCGPDTATPTSPIDNKAAGHKDDGHTHGEEDALHWVSKDIDADGFRLTLGHHGDHFHFGESIEPAAVITKDGNDVADAEVHVSLVSTDGKTVLAEEVATVYEPKTDSEPAHYAQGKLAIPKGAKEFKIRFRIKLPDVEKEHSHEIAVHAH